MSGALGQDGADPLSRCVRGIGKWDTHHEVPSAGLLLIAIDVLVFIAQIVGRMSEPRRWASSVPARDRIRPPFPLEDAEGFPRYSCPDEILHRQLETSAIVDHTSDEVGRRTGWAAREAFGTFRSSLFPLPSAGQLPRV